jgi:hypothetical protein
MPCELRALLEREVRTAFDEALARAAPIDPLLLVGLVLARHQHRDEVKRRLEFLWCYLEAYVGLLVILSGEPQ